VIVLETCLPTGRLKLGRPRGRFTEHLQPIGENGRPISRLSSRMSARSAIQSMSAASRFRSDSDATQHPSWPAVLPPVNGDESTAERDARAIGEVRALSGHYADTGDQDGRERFVDDVAIELADLSFVRIADRWQIQRRSRVALGAADRTGVSA
jgi:hypothetical protein